jgi:pyridoxal biosynthesis lyase PdxS
MTRGIHLVQEMDDAERDALAGPFAARYETLDRLVLEDMASSRHALAGTVGASPADTLAAIRTVLSEVHDQGRLPVVDFTAGGIATPADAALMMQMGSDGVFVGSGIFKSGDPQRRAKAIVEATTHFDDAAVVGEVSKDLGEAMVGRSVHELEVKLAERGI